MRTFLTSLCALIMLSGVFGAQAQTDAPTGPVILTVTGPDSSEALLDLDMLEGLAQTVTIVETPWYDGSQEFSGPLISDLMAYLDITGSELSFIAQNDYAATMPWSDIESYPVILATRHNGEPMSLRDKGPLFVIYPFDAYPELRNEVTYSRSVWQVKAIRVSP